MSFSLRSLILLTIASGVFLGITRKYLSRYEAQLEAAQHLLTVGATLESQSVGWPWLSRWLGSEYGTDVVAVHLEGSTIARKDLRWLEDLPQLERLYLARTSVDDQGLRHLRNLKQLRRLSLWKTRVTDEGMAHLKPLHNLVVLDIHGQCTEEALQHLKGLPNLRQLKHSFKLSNRGLRWLAAFPVLHAGQVQAAGITDEGMKQIGRLRQLKSLVIRNSAITVAGMAHLQGHKRLQSLEIHNCGLADDALEFLPDSIRHLWLAKTRVTLRGIAQSYGDRFRTVLIHGSAAHLRDNRTNIHLFNQTPRDAEAVRHFSCARRVDILLPGECDAETNLEYLNRFAQLRELAVAFPLTEQGLAWIGRLHGLRRLEISNAQDVTPSDLGHLAHLRQLEELRLRSTGLRGDQLTFLRKLPQLKSLELAGNPLQDEDLKHLKPLTQLQRLGLSFCPELGDDALAHVAELIELQVLSAQDTRISDHGLKQLYGLPRLRDATFLGSSVTKEGLKQLRDALRVQGGVIY